MKNYLQLFALMAVFLFSCTSKQEKALLGRWRVADVIFMDDANSILKSDSMQGNMLQRQRMAMKDMMQKNLYEFKADGTYITGNITGSAEGKWELNHASITFITQDESGEKSKDIAFEHLSTDSLVLLLNNDQTTARIKLLLYPVK